MAKYIDYNNNNIHGLGSHFFKKGKDIQFVLGKTNKNVFVSYKALLNFKREKRQNILNKWLKSYVKGNHFIVIKGIIFTFYTSVLYTKV